MHIFVDVMSRKNWSFHVIPIRHNRYETSDGQKRDESATFKDAPPTEDNPNPKAIDVVGSYEFTTPEGEIKLN